jgi:parallel beta-helix repeat protein
MENHMRRKCLAVGIILLFVVIAYAPVIAQSTAKLRPVSQGIWLYVGGSGPGNYTRIQDAIENASDGDTVFVYGGRYNEHLVISTAIDLLGESTNTTIIETVAADYNTCILLDSSNITISGFTILTSHGVFQRTISNDYTPLHHITISDNQFNGTINTTNVVLIFSVCDNCTITHNTFATHAWDNILLYWCSYCDISNNTIQSADWESSSIELYDVSYSKISNNTVITQYDGVRMSDSEYNTISDNYFYNNLRGVYIEDSYNISIVSNIIDAPPLFFLENIGELIGIELRDNFETRIEKNTISHYRCGVIIVQSHFTNVSMNNFMNNIVSARFISSDYSYIIWNQNYWERPRVFPKPIIGIANIFQVFPTFVQFDWHPAQEPYEIGGT